MSKYVLHPTTEQQLYQFTNRPVHAVMVTGSPGSGKTSVAQSIAASLLSLDVDELESYPHITTLSPIDGKALPIDSIRVLQRSLTLKIPGVRDDNRIKRVSIIEHAHLMTIEAQNALLKILEEPPVDTVLILTAPSADSVLPTIQSRVRLLPVIPPGVDDIKAHFANQGHGDADVDKALMLSGGLPGLTHALLNSEETHPLFEATTIARTILKSSSFERLVLVDSLSKQKQVCNDVLYILMQMSRTAIQRSTDTKNIERWGRIMKAAYTARVQLGHNTQPKLLLTNLMLRL